MFVLSIAAAIAAPGLGTPPAEAATYWTRVAAEARRMPVSTHVLHRAITAPVTPDRRRAVQRFCYALDRVDPGSGRSICRSRAAWIALGLVPAAPNAD